MIIKSILVFVTAIAISSCATNFYVVRHAEKSTLPANDPVLTETGQQRAIKLAILLKNKNIKNIYSTKTTRTISTAEPFSKLKSIKVKEYDAKNQSDFIGQLKKTTKNTLIVGHSNTIRYIINGLTETETLKKDLEDQEYANIYIIKRKKSGKAKFKKVIF
jgi:2,3-bisphosphoglycerate-dependent phosphoglycerate mutase